MEFPVRRAGFRELKRTESPLEFIVVAWRALVALPRVISVEWQGQKIDLSRVQGLRGSMQNNFQNTPHPSRYGIVNWREPKVHSREGGVKMSEA